MRLSDLQKYILFEALEIKAKKFSRNRLVKFYETKHTKTKTKLQIKAISKSIERLIDKELMTGYGVRTPHKWFLKEIKLTPKGRKVAKKLLGEQQRLPFRQSRKRAKSHTKTREKV